MNISSWSLRSRRDDGLKLLTSRLGWIFIIKRNKRNISLLVPLTQDDNTGWECERTLLLAIRPKRKTQMRKQLADKAMWRP